MWGCYVLYELSVGTLSWLICHIIVAQSFSRQPTCTVEWRQYITNSTGGTLQKVQAVHYKQYRRYITNSTGGTLQTVEAVHYKQQRRYITNSRGGTLDTVEAVNYKQQRQYITNSRGGTLQTVEAVHYKQQRRCITNCRGGTLQTVESVHYKQQFSGKMCFLYISLQSVCVVVHYCRHNSKVPLRHALLKLGRSAALSGEGGTVHVASH